MLFYHFILHHLEQALKWEVCHSCSTFASIWTKKNWRKKVWRFKLFSALTFFLNPMECPFQEWIVQSIPVRMECSFHSGWNGMEWFHSCRDGMSTPFRQNGMTTPFLQEWDSSISFKPEWNDHSIPAGIECHSTPNLKKYASPHISQPTQKIKTTPKLETTKKWRVNQK